MRKLPVWKGWTVDERLEEFRKARYGEHPTLEYVAFERTGTTDAESLPQETMRQYKVIRIYKVNAENKVEALTKVRADSARYLETEFAKEVETTGWMGSLLKQVLG